jgi:hypothetical protein
MSIGEIIKWEENNQGIIKIYKEGIFWRGLQSYENGVQFLGVVIKPHRTYIARRTKGNFYKIIEQWNQLIREKKILNTEEINTFISSINSYLGTMKHYKTYKLRKKMLLQNLSAYFWNHFYISGGYSKVVPKIRIVKN